MFADLIDENSILLDVDAGDWEDAVRKAAEPLVASGAVTRAYVDDIVDGARECGPYFVLTPHVALSHARPESGALAKAVAFCRLARPVEFGSRANDPVKYIFTIAAPSTESHIEELQELVELLSDPRLLETLDSAKDAQAVLEYFANCDQGGKNV